HDQAHAPGHPGVGQGAGQRPRPGADRGGRRAGRARRARRDHLRALPARRERRGRPPHGPRPRRGPRAVPGGPVRGPARRPRLGRRALGRRGRLPRAPARRGQLRPRVRPGARPALADALAGAPAIVDPMANDPGLFGPESVSWRVQREATVMLGGARALLMHSAHPLVVAGARQTGMYANQPWRRLERTLRQTYTVVFGTREEALAASKRIDDIHRGIKGVDPVTGLRYDARDPELLLWVHACLVDSFLVFERLTVGRLDDAGRQAFHEESMVSAELLRLPRERIPPTVPALRAYMDEVMASGILRMTDGARRVADLIGDPPGDVPRRPLGGLIGFLAFQTLPEPLRRLYGVRGGPGRQALVRASAGGRRAALPLPARALG